MPTVQYDTSQETLIALLLFLHINEYDYNQLSGNAKPMYNRLPARVSAEGVIHRVFIASCLIMYFPGGRNVKCHKD
jgi:hypothetical protein